MLQSTTTLRGRFAIYHRNAMGTMPYTKWSGQYGGLSRFYNRTSMAEEVKGNEPITLIDRRMMNYVHQTKLRHFQMGRSYQEKYRTTEVKLREGAFLRRRVHRKMQKAFIAFMQYQIKGTLEEQAKLVNAFGQAAVNRALGDPSATETVEQRARSLEAIRRKVRALPSIPAVPKHVATMKQIHNDRFNYRWRMN